MAKGEYKTVLFKVFDILEFSESEKEKALDDFKKRLAYELWDEVKKDLPQEDQPDWADSSNAPTDPKDQRIIEMKKKIDARFSKEELQEKSRPIFKKMLEEYVNGMTSDLSFEKATMLQELVGLFK